MISDENEHLHDVHERLLRMAAAGESDLSHAFAGANEDDAAPPPALPELEGAFGTYELERSLGHGGQGVVYLANDTRLGRKVALKLLSASGAAGATARARFEREATAASRLHHAGICTVYEAGELDGQRFLAMEYVDGESLPQWIARTTNSDAATDSGSRRTRVDAALHLVEQIARAVHAAHEAGVIHRDLKPQNIMLRRDGSPVVLDFGLARDDRDDGEVLTMQGDVLGTPAYMPPERVRGTAGKAADAREDVYGLGAILYECLTGQRPFRGHTREQLYQRILTSQVQDPRAADAAIPREARFVVETAMEKAPDRRYATALELADELKRLQQREPIQARPVPVWLRLQRWVQRHPGAAIPTIAVFVVLVAGVLISLLLLRQVETEARSTRIRALVAASGLEAERDPQRALLLGREASRQLGSEVPESLRVAVRSQLIEVAAQARRIADLEHSDDMVGAALSPDGSRVVTVYEGNPFPDETDEAEPAVRIWDVADLSSPIEYRVPGERIERAVISCAFDEARERVLLACYDGVVRIVSCRDGLLLHELSPAMEKVTRNQHRRLHDSAGCLSSFVPGGSDLVVTGSLDGARLWQLLPGERGGRMLWHDPRPRNPGVNQIAVSTNGTLCAASEHDGTVRLLRLADGSLVGQGHEQGPIRRLAFDPQRPLLLGCGPYCQGVVVWQTDRTGTASTGRPPELLEAGRLQSPKPGITRIEFSPVASAAGTTLALVENGRKIRIFQPTVAAPYYELAETISGAEGEYLEVLFSPDGSRLIAGCGDTAAHIYDLTGRRLDSLLGGGGPVSAIDCSPAGDRIVTLSQIGPGHVWHARDSVFRNFQQPKAVVRLAAGGSNATVILRGQRGVVMDLESGATSTLSLQITRPLAMRSDGERLAARALDGRLALWDLSGPEPVLEAESEALRELHRNGLPKGDCLEFRNDGALVIAAPPAIHLLHPDGRLEAVMPLDKPAAIALVDDKIVAVGRDFAWWDCEGRQADIEKMLPCSEGVTAGQGVTAMAPRQGSMLVLFRNDLIRIVDVAERRIRQEVDDPGARRAALSPDGTRLLTVGRKGHARVWDLTCDPIRVIADLRGHSGGVFGAAFATDGRELLTGAYDGTVRVWPANFAGLQQLVDERIVRRFTEVEQASFLDLINR